MPGIGQDGQAAVVQGAMKLKVLGREEGLATQIGGDDFAQWGGQARDVADGAGTRSVGSAKGFTYQISEVSLVGAGRFGGLDEHGLHDIG